LHKCTEQFPVVKADPLPEGVSGSSREFIGWLLKACAQDGVKPADLMDADAIELLADRLRTALLQQSALLGARAPMIASAYR